MNDVVCDWFYHFLPSKRFSLLFHAQDGSFTKQITHQWSWEVIIAIHQTIIAFSSSSIKSVLAMYFGTFISWIAGIRASVLLHNILLSNVLKCPMDFYDITPTGRILARFSHDIDTLDDRLIQILRQSLMISLRVRWQLSHSECN